MAARDNLTVTLPRADWARLLHSAHQHAAHLDANGHATLTARLLAAGWAGTAARLGDAVAAAEQVDRTLRAVEAVRDGAS